MFQKEQQLIETKIKKFCAASDIPLAELKWQPIPFSGEWGFATSFFQTAANEARAGKGGKPVPQRAQEMAEQVRDILRLAAQDGSVEGISRIDAVKGYLNLYFSTAAYASRVVDEVLVAVMRAPRTFTAEDTVEITCHGGLLPARRHRDRAAP